MSSKIILEICANSVDSALMAEKGGAQRVELCDNIYEGGTTPSYGAIKIAGEKLNIELNIIIRPRGGDFCYSDLEFEIMQKDIEFAKENGVNGVVIGLLHPDGCIDIKRTKQLVELAEPMSVTFHRAFDVSNEPFQALDDIIDCGCDRLLTSGQKNKAYDGVDLLKNLIEKANNRIIIMPGSGINEANIQEIYEKTGATEFHVSLRKNVLSKMNYKNEDINMGGIPQINEFNISVTDSDRVQKMIQILKKL
ncbi:MAG: copper homeostasis protein CutC [Bacteroidales bacterium]|nr:copper homeostasis protein CutC [Bacteroidales bacterium]